MPVKAFFEHAKALGAKIGKHPALSTRTKYAKLAVVFNANDEVHSKLREAYDGLFPKLDALDALEKDNPHVETSIQRGFRQVGAEKPRLGENETEITIKLPIEHLRVLTIAKAYLEQLRRKS